MSTFVQAHDFDGKTVIPFCTSGGSSIGRSGENLAMLVFFVLAGYALSELTQKNSDKKYTPKPLIWPAIAVIIGAVLNFTLK